ncbi:MAG: mevalonate kinase [Cystobacterineae bacterium]|nr:mevalonate kinase [Cystobacterineae bacterium]
MSLVDPASSAHSGVAFGAGKVILFGEHAVVYGYPAIAGALPLGVQAHFERAERCQLLAPQGLNEKQLALLQQAFGKAAEVVGLPKVCVRLEARLPMGAGLGSSAAVSVACAKALAMAAFPGEEGGAWLERAAPMALCMERVFHGNPSGVDHSTSLRETLLWFCKGQAEKLSSPAPLKLLVAMAGKRSSTKSTVEKLRERQEKWPKHHARLFEEIGRCTEEARGAIEAGDLALLGELMNVNQGLLSALQLDSENLTRGVHRLRTAGALGAKLTGAGGDGGAIIGLFENPEAAEKVLRAEGIECFACQLAGPRS